MRYIKQPATATPLVGDQFISHFTKTLEEDTPQALDLAVNTYFADLAQALEDTPVIQTVNFAAYPAPPGAVYICQIHYLLIGPE